MAEIGGFGAEMNDDRLMNEMYSEMERMTMEKNFMEMDYKDLRLLFLSKHYLEIGIERRKRQLKIEKIKFEIGKLSGILRTTNFNEPSEIIRLVEEKMKEIEPLYGGDSGHPVKLMNKDLKILMKKLRLSDTEIRGHPVKLMNKDLKILMKKLRLLDTEIHKIELWINNTKERKMKIKDNKKDIEYNDKESSDNERETIKYNCKMEGFLRAKYFRESIRGKHLINAGIAEEEREKRKANGLNYARETIAGLRTVTQHWHFKSQPLSVAAQQDRAGVFLNLKMPRGGGSWHMDGLCWRGDQWPVTYQIYSLKLKPCCCIDDDQACCSVDVSGQICLPGCFSINVKSQTLTKKDPHLILDGPTFIPLSLPCFPSTIFAKLVLRSSDEPDKDFILSDEVEFHHSEPPTRSMEVADEVYMSGKEFSEGTSEHVNLGTGKQYMLKLTHGIVVNTIVANISVHLHKSLLDSWDGKCKIIAYVKQNPSMRVVLVNSKKVRPTFDYNGSLQLLRPRICVDFFNTLRFEIKAFRTWNCLLFNPRDCYSRDNCEHKEAFKGLLKVQVKWSTRETFPGLM